MKNIIIILLSIASSFAMASEPILRIEYINEKLTNTGSSSNLSVITHGNLPKINIMGLDAIYFDGNYQNAIEIQPSTLLDLNKDFTIRFYYKNLSHTQGGEGIIDLGRDVECHTIIFRTGIEKNFKNFIHVELDGSNCYTHEAFCSGYFIDMFGLTNIALIRRSGQYIFIINGLDSIVYYPRYEHNIDGFGYSLSIGRLIPWNSFNDNGLYASPFNGYIASFEFYNKALSADEILEKIEHEINNSTKINEDRYDSSRIEVISNSGSIMIINKLLQNKIKRIKIYDILKNQIYSNESNFENSMIINGLPIGIYFISIEFENNSIYRNIIMLN